MSPEVVLVALLGLCTLVLAVSNRVRLDAIGIGLVIVLAASGILGLGEAFAGFANPTVVTLGALYVLGDGLTRTGALEFMASFLLRISNNRESWLLPTLCVSAAALSAVASNTAVILVLMPIAMRLARDLDCSPSRLLMPLAFASILGGTTTLVGSSTNLLASGAAEASGHSPIGMFEMTPIALPLCAIGLVWLIVSSRYLLPERSSLTGMLAKSSPREYVSELLVGSESELVGQDLLTSFEGRNLQPLFVVRHDEVHWPPLHGWTLRSGDIVMVRGAVEALVETEETLGLERWKDTRVDPATLHLYELAVAPHSRLVGTRIGDLKLWRDFGLVPVAVLRGHHHYRDRTSDMALRAADLLLVTGPESSRERVAASADLYLLEPSAEAPRLRAKARIALTILLAVVLAFSLGPLLGFDTYLPIPIVALLGALAMVVAGAVPAAYAYRSIDWSILVFVVGALAFGHALEVVGLAASIAGVVVSALKDFGPGALIAGILLVGTVLNQFTSPYAVVVVLVPIAIAAAAELGLEDPRPFVLAVAFAGSNAFPTPIGHQVNLMVFGPGGYRFSDFLRLGVPLAIVYWIVVSGMLALQVA